MKYILLNIKSFIKNEKMIFIITLLCIFVSSIILNFSYGLYMNYDKEKKQSSEELRDLNVDIIDDVEVTKLQVKNFIEHLPDEINENTELFYLADIILKDNQGTKYLDVRIRYNPETKTYEVPDIIKENFSIGGIGSLYDGRYITDEEEATGAKVAVIAFDKMLGTYSDYTKSLLISDNKISFLGQEYKVIGRDSGVTTAPVVPFLSIPDDYTFNDYFSFTFTDYLDRKSYEKIQEVANEYMPDALVFPELNLPDSDSLAIYNNIIIIAVFIAILSVLNYAILYYFIIKKRSRSLAITKICGCTNTKGVFIYLGECVILCVPTYFIGILLYRFALKRYLSNLFTYMEEAYNLKVYLAIFAVYFVVTLIIFMIMIIRHMSKSIIEEWRDA